MLLVSILLVSFSTLFAGCNFIGVNGNGKVTKEVRETGNFSAIDISGAFDIFLTQGDKPGVIVEADENLMKLIKTDVEGTTLKVYNDKPINHPTMMKVYITFTELNKIEVSGAVNIKGLSKISVPELKINGSGASDAELLLEVKALEVDNSSMFLVIINFMVICI